MRRSQSLVMTDKGCSRSWLVNPAWHGGRVENGERRSVRFLDQLFGELNALISDIRDRTYLPESRTGQGTNGK